MPGLQSDRLTCMLLPPGDGVKQLLWRLQHGELPSKSQHHPKVVVVHVGTNGESTFHSRPFPCMHDILCGLCGLLCLPTACARSRLHAQRLRTGLLAAASDAQAC